jgi:hypothetical protein
LGFNESLVDDRALRTLPRLVVANKYYGPKEAPNPGPWQQRTAELLERHYTQIYDDGIEWRVYLRGR